MFDKIKSAEELQRFALAVLIAANGWGWFESLADVLYENGWDDKELTALLAEGEQVVSEYGEDVLIFLKNRAY
jgi:hypothetical protein